MNLKNHLKKIICFMLALMMLFASAGCSNKESGKKKVIVKKKIIKTQVSEKDNNKKGNKADDNDYDYDGDNNNNKSNDEDDDNSPSKIRRKLYEAEEVKEKYVEVNEPEFTHEYVNWAGPSGYTIVYGASTDLNGEKTYINRVAANLLKNYFIEKYNITLEVKRDTDFTASNPVPQKLIVVGDVSFYNGTSYKSNLTEKQFAVNLKNNNLVFEGGHFVMVEKAVDWFLTLEVKSGKVAELEGESEDFVSTKTVYGRKYTYVWGDEFDGNSIDSTKWYINQMHEWNEKYQAFFDDDELNFVENGRLKLMVDRYYDESNELVEYGDGGVVTTCETMLFKRGYAEFNVLIPYTESAWPALWMRSAPSGARNSLISTTWDKAKVIKGQLVENIQPLYEWEIDILEVFGETDRFGRAVHKWYRSPAYKNGRVYDYDGVDITNRLSNAVNTGSAYSVSEADDKARWWNWSGSDAETLDRKYHTYNFLWDETTLHFGVDGTWYNTVEFDNDGWLDNYSDGLYNTDQFFYFLINNHLYLKYKPADMPIYMAVDSVRLYQLPDNADWDTHPNGLQEDGYDYFQFINPAAADN